MYYLARLEETALSTWLRESTWGFFSALTLHSLSMALVVGINFAIAVRLLGFLPALQVRLLGRFLPLMWAACGVVLLSGSLLLLAYPAKALTNPVFYLKLVALGLALAIVDRLGKLVFDGSLGPVPEGRYRILAGGSLLLWLTTITAGRFLAYTHQILLASRVY